MATRTTDIERTYLTETDEEVYPAAGSDIIYAGSMVGENGSGYARPLIAGDVFLGFNVAGQVDNSAGAAGAKTVRVKRKGRVKMTVTGASAITVNDKPAVYASDDDTLTLTSTSNSLVGYVGRWVSGSICVVVFDADLVRAALQA